MLVQKKAFDPREELIKQNPDKPEDAVWTAAYVGNESKQFDTSENLMKPEEKYLKDLNVQKCSKCGLKICVCTFDPVKHRIREMEREEAKDKSNK